MKKLLLSLTLAIGLSLAASAQINGAIKKLSVGAEGALPTTGRFQDFLMAGASLQFEQPIAQTLNLTVAAGYARVFSTLKRASLTVDYVPLKAGGKYYFGSNFYGAGEIGAAFKLGNGEDTAFAFAPTFGAAFAIADQSSLDFGLRYETWSNQGSTSFFGLRVAFVFGL